MKQLVKLAWRSIWRNRRRTIITIASIVFGLTLAIFFIGFANGVYARMIDDAVRMLGGHVTLEHPGYRDAPSVDMTVGHLDRLRRRIEALPQVERTKVLVLGQGVAKSGGGAAGVAVVGVEPSEEQGSSPMSKKIIAGSYLGDGDRRTVVVGSQLAKQLKLGKKTEAGRLAAILRPFIDRFNLPMERVLEDFQLWLAVGKKVVLTSTNIHGELVEELLRVKGVFEVGAVEIDGYLIQMPISFAQELYGMEAGQATQLGVVIRDPESQWEVLSRVRQIAQSDQVRVLPWEEVMPELASYIQIDGGSNLVFQGIIIFLIMFTIFNTILMSVLERKREFAVLLALGTPPRLLRLQVMVETAFIGLLGCTLGLALGAVVTYVLQIHGFDISSLYEEGVSVSGVAINPVIYPQLTVKLLAWLGGLVFGATMLLSLYPMQQAARIQVADLLR